MVLQHRNIKNLCKALSKSWDGANALPVPTDFIPSDDIVLSSGQEQMLILHSFDPASGFYNQPLVLGLYGDLDINLLQNCLHRILERQSILRTTYAANANGGWSPIVIPVEAAKIPLGTVDLRSRKVCD